MADGCCCVVINGDVVAQGSQFSLKDVEVLVAQVDLDAQTNIEQIVSQIEDCSKKINIGDSDYDYYQVPFREEEIAFGPGCWLWNYLRRSGASGFLLSLSGGAHSPSVAAIVGCMCQLVVIGKQNLSVFQFASFHNSLGGYFMSFHTMLIALEHLHQLIF
ncbi:hypothetical protein GIB67_025872 [Kingdonia uniflora]|uniref:Uncharacterized protein n=1 Tax=Kingdonia uniflora TaxID=39325 RepID=A0A7J7MDL1_9MAGN|nr:hypothetical protein GIB67_025872 [Kingdonia uniflora]